VLGRLLAAVVIILPALAAAYCQRHPSHARVALVDARPGWVAAARRAEEGPEKKKTVLRELRPARVAEVGGTTWPLPSSRHQAETYRPIALARTCQQWRLRGAQRHQCSIRSGSAEIQVGPLWLRRDADVAASQKGGVGRRRRLQHRSPGQRLLDASSGILIPQVPEPQGLPAAVAARAVRRTPWSP